MIDKYWKSSDGTFNPPQRKETLIPESEEKKYKNLKYFTLPFSEAFENVDKKHIFIDISKQQDHIKKLVWLYERHDFFNKAISAKVLDQYAHFYNYQWHYYKIDELKLWLIKQEWKENTFIKAEKPQNPLIRDTTRGKKKFTISREAIRKITGYTPYVIPVWSETGKQTYIEWQDVILQDLSPIIAVDWSRQIWKSLTIAEKSVEESFIPNNDILVWAFIKKTTDVIRNYIIRFIKDFPEGTFEHFKSEWYILNTVSWTRIYFRTLADGADNVLWLTLKLIIVDEAQLIPTEVFEDALEPTLATTNGNMILIGTPWRTAKWYYYDLIMEAKRGIEEQWIKIGVKSETNPDLSYYQIDYTQNPLLAPRLRAKIIANIEKGSIQRQYCCNWNSWEDQLFKPEQISEYPPLNDNWYFTITFDPARKGTDRSAYCVSYVYNGIIYILMSWFVPKIQKWKWSKQIKFYSKWLIKQFSNFKNVAYGVDLRGIWEWFSEAWMNHFKNPEPSISLIEITYTTWNTETIKWLDWTISKTKLISNWVDYIDEWLVKVLKVANKDLLEEFQFLYEDEDNKWFIAMKSTFKDDIANAFLTNIYIIHTRGYIKRSYVAKTDGKETLAEWNECFESKKKPKKRKEAW